MPQTHTITVGMVLFPNLTQLDLTGPYEVLARMPDTVVTLVAETPAPVRSERGLTITPDTTFADAPQCDVLFVPGGIGVNPMMEHAPALEFLRASRGCSIYQLGLHGRAAAGCRGPTAGLSRRHPLARDGSAADSGRRTGSRARGH